MIYTTPVCKGDILIGSACRKCEKCRNQIKLFQEAQAQFNKTGKTPSELGSYSASRISSLEDKLEALTLRVNYLADPFYGTQAVAHPSVTCFPEHTGSDNASLTELLRMFSSK